MALCNHYIFYLWMKLSHALNHSLLWPLVFHISRSVFYCSVLANLRPNIYTLMWILFIYGETGEFMPQHQLLLLLDVCIVESKEHGAAVCL